MNQDKTFTKEEQKEVEDKILKNLLEVNNGNNN